MEKKYLLFDFQSILANLREKYAGEEKFNELIEGIDENSSIEDMPFYKDYLSRFDVEKAFDDFKLVVEEKDLYSREELYLLFRLIIASFSSKYEILYDKPSNSIDFSVTVKSGEQEITKNISELWIFQIGRLFEIYVDEQVRFCISFIQPHEIEDLKAKQKLRVMVFEKKVRQINDLQGTDEILSNLDDLLNS